LKEYLLPLNSSFFIAAWIKISDKRKKKKLFQFNQGILLDLKHKEETHDTERVAIQMH